MLSTRSRLAHPTYNLTLSTKVQDCTPVGLFSLILACGGDMNRVCLAGDSAQQCVPGVEFRFTEVRKLANYIGAQDFEKPVELHVNFRYSEMIRKLSNAVFEKMIRAFPASADRVDDASLDGGRVRPCFV